MNIIKVKDFWLGIFLLCGGVTCYLQSITFDETSSTYPSLLSLIIVIIGVVIIFHAKMQVINDDTSVSAIFNQIKGSSLIVLIIIGWTALLSLDVGYILSSLIAVGATLFFLGVKDLKKTFAISFIIVTVVFSLFYLLFDIPLPMDSISESIFG